MSHKIIETYEYRVPLFIVCPIANADVSGIEDADIQVLDEFTEKLSELVKRERGTHYNIEWPENIDDAKYFAYTNDVDRLAGDVIDIKVHIWDSVATYEGFLPLFPGFYGTIYDIDDYSVGEEVGYWLTEHGQYPEFLGDVIGDEIYDIDYKGYIEHVARNACDWVHENLSEVFEDKGRLLIEFTEVHSPKYYNYSNDAVYCNISMNDAFNKALGEYLEDNSETLNKWLHERYTSCSGFISHYANNVADWRDNTGNWTVFSQHELASLLEFVLINEDVEDEMYSIMEDVHVSEYINIKLPEFDDLPCEISDKLLGLESFMDKARENVKTSAAMTPEYADKARVAAEQIIRDTSQEYAAILTEYVKSL